MIYTIGQLGSKFGLSRSTLLYYDKLGLLSPSGRSEANYRRYTQKDVQRLERIVMFRNTGMSLERIAELLDREGSNDSLNILEAHVFALNEEMNKLRAQQDVTIDLLTSHLIAHPHNVMSKQRWVELLASKGMSERDMWQWHSHFESRMPEAHEAFLRSLNIPKSEIRNIRLRAKEGIPFQS